MALLSRRIQRPSRSLTASAQRIDEKNAQAARRLVRPWQGRSLSRYEDLGQIHYAAQFYARPLSRLRLFAAELDDEGEPQESDDPKLKALWDRVQDPGGGRSVMCGQYGRLRFLTGESYLVCTPDEDYGEKWEMLSVAELKINTDGKTYNRIAYPGAPPEVLTEVVDGDFEPLDDEAVVYRLWRRDPVFSELADAPMRGVLDDCDRLILLNLAMRARALSRIAKPGLLCIPNEISPPNPDASPDEDAMSNPFFADIYKSAEAAISDPGSAAAAMPILWFVDGAFIDQIKYIKLYDPAEEYQEGEQRKECIVDIATGLDFPAEALLGLGDVNKWNGLEISEDGWKHVLPVAQEMVDDFTSAYLRPAARAEGVANWQRVCVGFDAAAVINHPDRAKDAKELYALRAISKAALRDANAFDDDDAPTQPELDEMIGVAIRDGSYAKYGIPSVKSGGIEPEAGTVENPRGTSTSPTGPTTGSEREPGPPAPPSEVRTASAAPDLDVVALVQVAQLRGAAELAVERAREVAGAKLRSRSESCAECMEAINGAPNRRVVALLGADRVRHVLAESQTSTRHPAISERDLVKGAGEGFVAVAVRMGLTPEWANSLAEVVETHAARTLYDLDQPPLPSAFAALARRAQPAVPEPDEELVPA